MKKIIPLVVVCTQIFAIHPNFKSRKISATSNEALKSKVESILPKGKDLKYGILLTSIDTGEVLFEKNADELLIPASTNKIFTAYTALKKLKPNATFKTYVLINSPVRNFQLGGDLYIKGGGDPSLVSERLWMLVNEFVRAGIKTVKGNIIVDSSYYDSVRTPESRPKYLKDQAYNAPVGALSFNFNTTTVYVRPNEQSGQPPVVYTDPENTYIDVVNQATTGKAGSQNTLNVNRTEFVKGDIGDTVLLRGSIPVDGKEQHFYKNIVNPALYTGHMVKTFMEQRGLRVEGTVKEGSVPSEAKQILEFESQPLWQVIWGMNKFSNNFVADQTLKKLGAETWGPPGTLEKGVTVVQDMLQEIGIPKNTYEIHDGSGLTRQTKVTSRQIVKVLSAAYKDFAVFPEFISSLVIAGEDGTLRRRFPTSQSEAIQLRAKTGTLDGVAALAGYTVSQENELLGFAIILNDSKGKYGKMSPWIDKIALEFHKYSRK